MRGTGIECVAETVERRFIPAHAGNSSVGAILKKRGPVHPRACGEQFRDYHLARGTTGSSPRMRGTELEGRADVRHQRFIPAHAGNSRPRSAPCVGWAVHPRACGEQPPSPDLAARRRTSSPRMRGTAGFHRGKRLGGRFIPAHAGNSALPGSCLRDDAVHPRACGEQGLPGPDLSAGARFIPAHAGNRCSRLAYWIWVSVHPRACGEQADSARWARCLAGSSPRMRGTGDKPIDRRVIGRFIPAHAGNRATGFIGLGLTAVHPRACGEQVSRRRARWARGGSSPRMRGTDELRSLVQQKIRFIPAHAGNSRKRRGTRQPRPVHPRACGEQEEAQRIVEEYGGSSPRMRGTG